MTDYLDINLRNWEERAVIHARDTTGDYMLDRFRAGEDSLHEIEAAELGDICGKRVLHLQCHIGRDTLCLARRGATVTGLDFSKSALSVARRLSEETGLKADFVLGTVDQAPNLTPGPFDLVFTTWGTICWLPDTAIWAKVIASVLAPGGELYFADAVLGGLIDAGLTITMFREHEVLPWRGLPILVPASDRLWRLPDGYPRIPLSYSLRAKKTP